MGVQLLEGDWNASAAGNDTAEGATTHPSARQRRWTAFRSWYRGGRVFDRAHESLITAAMLRRPPSPGSQGRPLTPHIAPADGPRPIAPDIDEGETEKDTLPNRGNAADDGDDAVVPPPPRKDNAAPVPFPPEEGVQASLTEEAMAGGVVVPNVEGALPTRRDDADTGPFFLEEDVHKVDDSPLYPKEEGVFPAPAAEAIVAGVDIATASAAAALEERGGTTSRGVTPMEVLRCRASSHTPPPPPEAKRHVVLLRKDGPPPAAQRARGSSSATNRRAGFKKPHAHGHGGDGAEGGLALEDRGAEKGVGGVPGDGSCLAAGEEDAYASQVLDAARLDGLTGWEEDRAPGRGELEGGSDHDDSRIIADGLPPLSKLGGTVAAKRLRMEARRKFLEARTVTSKEAASKVSRSAVHCVPRGSD